MSSPNATRAGSEVDLGGVVRHDDRVVHLKQKTVARRWNVSTRSLERWRIKGIGPAFLKINGRVLYRLEDIVAFEREHRQQSTKSAIGGVL